MSKEQGNIIYNLLCDWCCEIYDEATIGTPARMSFEILDEIEKILNKSKRRTKWKLLMFGKKKKSNS